MKNIIVGDYIQCIPFQVWKWYFLKQLYW